METELSALHNRAANPAASTTESVAAAPTVPTDPTDKPVETAADTLEPELSNLIATNEFAETLRLVERIVVHSEFGSSQAKFLGQALDLEALAAQATPAEPEPEPVKEAPVPAPADQATPTGTAGAAVAPAMPSGDAADAADAAAVPAEPAGEVPEPASKPDAAKPGLKTLWTYSCAETRGRTVTCMEWNKKNRMIIAAGYGSFNYGSTEDGLACCWSLKNPAYPERIYRVPAGVVCSELRNTCRVNRIAPTKDLRSQICPPVTV